MTSRLFDKEGKPRKYNKILFIAGYNPDVPSMETEYLGVKKQKDLYHILVGKVLSKENMKALAKKKAAPVS